MRFYDDRDCIEFVKHEFPEYLDAYRRLSKDVERSDFFRYMVVLKMGGVYADIDTECKQPLDAIIRSKDTLIVGWENEFADAEKAAAAWYARTRQILQWVFAAAPGHPVLRNVCDQIARNVQHTYSQDTRLDTLERTGPGIFTDTVVKHAGLHAPKKREDPWTVRILPRVQFGAPRSPAYGLSPNDPSVAVLHHALASWRLQQSWWRFWQRRTVEDTSKQLSRSWEWRSAEARQQHVDRMRQLDAAISLYPVSVVFDPTFDMFTHRLGHGDRRSGWDVSSALTTHGSWQPSVQPNRRPSLADAVVGSLGLGSDLALVDVGAGYGFLTLAAAARGHRVHAFEMAPLSLEAFEASIAYNGFEHLVTLHKVPLGAPQQEEDICVVPKPSLSAQLHSSGNNSNSSSSFATSPLDAAAGDMDMFRGYSTPQAHRTASQDCQLTAKRLPGVAVLEGRGERVGAIRVSANGWEGFVLEGFEPLLSGPQPPAVIAVEWNPAAMKRAGYTDPLALVHRLYNLGYTDVSHSGFICDERWYSVTYGVRRRGGINPEEVTALKQPTWCRLQLDIFGLLLERASSTYPETLLFINKAAGQAQNSTAGTPPRKPVPQPTLVDGNETARSAGARKSTWEGLLGFFSRRREGAALSWGDRGGADNQRGQQPRPDGGVDGQGAASVQDLQSLFHVGDVDGRGGRRKGLGAVPSSGDGRQQVGAGRDGGAAGVREQQRRTRGGARRSLQPAAPR